MKPLAALLLGALLLFCGSCSGQRAPGKDRSAFLFQNAVVVLSDSAGGAAALSVGDAYTRSFTPFDLQGRLGRTDAGGTEGDYLRMAARQCRSWSPAQQDSLRASFAALESWLKQNRIRLKLPDTVRVVHSSCEEELGSEGYTRRNLIVLNGGTDLHLVSHELFHVLSRHNPALRDRLYNGIGFVKCAPIRYQEAFGGKTITNPDCPVVEHYATIPYPLIGDSVGGTERIALVLYSEKPFAGGSVFFNYLKIGLLMLDGKAPDLRPKMIGSAPDVQELNARRMPLAVSRLRVNTPYLLHPEEICAEHFSLLIEGAKVAYPERLSVLRQVLQDEK